MRITYFLRDNGACGYYRADLPLQTVAAKQAAGVFKIEKGDNVSRIERGLEADIVLIPRAQEKEIVDVIKHLKSNGKKVVVDYDDDIWNVSPLSPHYKEYGTENVVIEHNGDKLPLWEDGKNFSIKLNQQRLDCAKEAFELADMVTTTTDNLADVYRKFNDNVKILPNCVDTNLWQPLPLKEHDDIRLYWSGGSSHYQDWMLLKDVIPAVMSKYPKTKLVLMGMQFEGALKEIPKDRIEFHPWVHVPAYPYKTAIINPDIALIPLEDNEFNRSKSPIKFIEQGSLGVPAVCSLVSPYKEVYTGTNGVFVENNSTAGWINGISALVEDKMLRWKIGGEAKKTVDQYFDINTQYEKWVTAYWELLDNGTK